MTRAARHLRSRTPTWYWVASHRISWAGKCPSAWSGRVTPLLTTSLHRWDMDLHEAAAGIVQIVNNNMMGALRVVSVEKGYDPRDFALVAFGGAGPMHAGQLAELLGMSTDHYSAYPGLLSALGLLSTDLRHDAVRTFVQRGPAYDLAWHGSRVSDPPV